MEVAVRFEGVSMRFDEVLANDDVTLEIRKGEVFALVGENGAGKTTLMKILYGLHSPTSGSVTVQGKRLVQHSPAESLAAGVGMVHQHFMLVPSFSVAQNVVLGQEPKVRGVFFDQHKASEIVEGLRARYGLRVDPAARVEDLSLGEQQRVEILKALRMGADVLVLDEPTAVLTPKETEELFAVIRRIVEDEGMTVIIITHKLYEVMAVSDRVGVMRAGKLVGVAQTSDVSEAKLASMMVGREMIFAPLERAGALGDECLRVEGLEADDKRAYPALRGVSFGLRRGEILGIAGVEGNGQSELVEVLTGLRHAASGRVVIAGQDCVGMDPGQIRALGVAHVPEDRIATGLAIDAGVSENLLLGRSSQRRFAAGGIQLRWKEIRAFAKELAQRFDIRSAGVDAPVSSLSGGNMQKVVVAREFSFDAPLLIVSQPTRGVDIGASAAIHEFIVEKRNAGAAILLVSADLDEVFRLSDRIVTMYEGRISGEFAKGEFDKEAVGLCMAGGRKEAAS